MPTRTGKFTIRVIVKKNVVSEIDGTESITFSVRGVDVGEVFDRDREQYFDENQVSFKFGAKQHDAYAVQKRFEDALTEVVGSGGSTSRDLNREKIDGGTYKEGGLKTYFFDGENP